MHGRMVGAINGSSTSSMNELIYAYNYAECCNIHLIRIFVANIYTDLCMHYSRFYWVPLY